MIKLTYYFHGLSQWSYFADLALDKILERFGADIELDWKVTDGKPITTNPDDYRWIYRRSKYVSGIETNAAWRRKGDVTLPASSTIEAVRMLGADADSLRRRFLKAVVIDGKPAGSFDSALDLMSSLSGIDRETLARAMPAAEKRVLEATAEYHSLPANVVPCLVARNDIGDTAILSGLFKFETFERVISEMLEASKKYAEFAAANQPVPQ